ncbi:MAG: hypothetical protein Q6362_004310 [Candidatus Wukongarchaeota archaeon]|nr:hypothetical protein [Candidatus Wukongarchaeota archaeon]MDO8128654.1 hypothetical protein [Candidatus Wukongarchaeota archaeon]
METFTGAKPFVNDSYFEKKRGEALIKLESEFKSGSIDVPHNRNYERLCYASSLLYYSELLWAISKVEYRIAYMAFCFQNNELGRKLFDDLKAIIEIDLAYIQFGSTEWFWERCLNSYVLQVEPERSKTEDRVYVDMKEALHIEELRNKFFVELKKILQKHQQLVRK